MRERTTFGHALGLAFFVLLWGTAISYDTRSSTAVHATPPDVGGGSAVSDVRAFVRDNSRARVVEAQYYMRDVPVRGVHIGDEQAGKIAILEGTTTGERLVIQGRLPFHWSVVKVSATANIAHLAVNDLVELTFGELTKLPKFTLVKE